MSRGDSAPARTPRGGAGRRAVLRGTLAAPAALALPSLAGAAPASGRAPGQVRRGAPQANWGVQTGDVTVSSGLVWVRSDRAARMVVETAATESFRGAQRWEGPLLGAETDFTGRTALRGLPPGEEIHYRVTLTDPSDPRRAGEPVHGSFRTAPASGRQSLRFLWSGDLAGQGWGISPERGGYPVFAEMLRLDPDFFLNSGDTIYADNPIEAEVELPDGGVWRNVTSEAKADVAQTLEQFRGNHRYNLQDEKLRRFNARVPVLAQWDDHEVVNNWFPGEVLEDERYTVRDVDTLAARSLRAFSEYFPLSSMAPGDEDGRVYRVVHHGPLLDVFLLDMRSYRNANSPGTEPDDRQGILGERQLAWLKRALSRSRATWKVIASDMPIGLVVEDDGSAVEAIAQGDPGEPLGRELQLAELLRHIKHQRITGTVWFTTDVHYTSAQRYDPSQASFGDFEPFWEFVSGPLHAGGFPALELDRTFGPDQRFVKAPEEANTPPSPESSYFGQVDIDGGSGEMTVRLRSADGEVLFTKTLQPGRVGQ